jgi:hypothetical protein
LGILIFQNRLVFTHQLQIRHETIVLSGFTLHHNNNKESGIGTTRHGFFLVVAVAVISFPIFIFSFERPFGGLFDKRNHHHLGNHPFSWVVARVGIVLEGRKKGGRRKGETEAI